MKKIALITAVVVLTGCAARGPVNFGAAPRLEDPTTTCNQANANDARFAPLRARTGTGSGGPTLAMRTSKDTPTDEEKQALSVWSVAYQTCVERGRDFRAVYVQPTQAAWIEAHHSRTIALVAKLYSGEIPWGTYLDQRDALERETALGLATASQASAQAAAAQASADAARGMALMQAIQASRPPPVTYQPVPVAPMPRTITCTTSQGLGNTVNTTCR